MGQREGVAVAIVAWLFVSCAPVHTEHTMIELGWVTGDSPNPVFWARVYYCGAVYPWVAVNHTWRESTGQGGLSATEFKMDRLIGHLLLLVVLIAAATAMGSVPARRDSVHEPAG